MLKARKNIEVLYVRVILYTLFPLGDIQTTVTQQLKCNHSPCGKYKLQQYKSHPCFIRFPYTNSCMSLTGCRFARVWQGKGRHIKLLYAFKGKWQYIFLFSHLKERLKLFNNFFYRFFISCLVLEIFSLEVMRCQPSWINF